MDNFLDKNYLLYYDKNNNLKHLSYKESLYGQAERKHNSA